MFIPNNPSEARSAIKNDNFQLFREEYETKRKNDFEEHEKKKRKMVAGAFRASYYNDNYGATKSSS